MTQESLLILLLAAHRSGRQWSQKQLVASVWIFLWPRGSLTYCSHLLLLRCSHPAFHWQWWWHRWASKGWLFQKGPWALLPPMTAFSFKYLAYFFSCLNSFIRALCPFTYLQVVSLFRKARLIHYLVLCLEKVECNFKAAYSSLVNGHCWKLLH